MAAKTRNTCISGITTDRIEIPTAYLVFSISPSWKQLFLGDCGNDRQPEYSNIDVLVTNLAIWAVRRCRNHLVTLVELVVVDNTEFAVGISMLS